MKKKKRFWHWISDISDILNTQRMVEAFEEPHVLVYENDFEILKFFYIKLNSQMYQLFK